MIESKSTKVYNNYSELDISIDQTVSVEEYFYPEFSMADFLSSLGGSLGLWLGVGVVQIGGYGTIIVQKLKSMFQRFL